MKSRYCCCCCRNACRTTSSSSSPAAAVMLLSTCCLCTVKLPQCKSSLGRRSCLIQLAHKAEHKSSSDPSHQPDSLSVLGHSLRQGALTFCCPLRILPPRLSVARPRRSGDLRGSSNQRGVRESPVPFERRSPDVASPTWNRSIAGPCQLPLPSPISTGMPPLDWRLALQ